jgi:4-hydroxy-2-oxoheptanedioate aldolase
MSAERLLTALADGRRAFGIPLRTPDPAIVEIAAIAGYDWVSISLEHSALTVREVATLQRAADARGISTLVHMADAYDHRILALLDEGIGGVVAPHVTKASEVEALVSAARFPPLGHRGAAGVTRRADYGARPFAAYAEAADKLVVVGISIEDVEGVENVDSIFAVPGLTLTYIGLHDLTQSYGHPGEFRHPDVRDAVSHVVATAKKHGVAVGLSEKGFTIEELCELGANLIINAPAGEYSALLDALTSRLDQARAAADAWLEAGAVNAR